MPTTEAGSNVRELILDTALALMAEHGAVGMSMRQLASACGVQVAAIYHYFPSKDALLATVVAERQYGSRMAEALPVDPDAPAPERLRQLFLAVFDGAIQEEAIWRVILIEGLRGESSVLPVGQDLLGILYPASRDWVAQFLPEIDDADAVGHLIVGQLLGGFVRRVFEPDTDPLEIANDQAAALIRIVLG